MPTPIERTMTAIREGTASEVRKLLAEYPELLAEDGPDMLDYAAECNRVDVLPILVAAGIDVNVASLRHTPLGSAARSDAFEAVQWLLDHGADINALFPGGTPAADNQVRESQIKELPKTASTLGKELERIFDAWAPATGERVLLCSCVTSTTPDNPLHRRRERAVQ